MRDKKIDSNVTFNIYKHPGVARENEELLHWNKDSKENLKEYKLSLKCSPSSKKCKSRSHSPPNKNNISLLKYRLANKYSDNTQTDETKHLSEVDYRVFKNDN